MKRTLPIAIVVAAASFAITWLFAGNSKPINTETTTTSAPPPRLVGGDPPGTEKRERTRFSVNHRSSDDYRAAWADLASRRLSKQDRKRVQRDLFNAWAEVDLEGAIEAALKLPWDDETIPSTQVMVDRSEDVWRLIQQDRFGPLGGTVLLKAWANAIGKKDPMMLMGYLHEMKGIELRNSVRSAIRQIGNKEDAVKIWKALVGRTDLSTDDRLLLGDAIGDLGGFMGAADLRELMNKGQGLSAESAARALVAKLKRNGDSTSFPTEIEAAPEGVRNAMAIEMLSEHNNTTPKSTLAALNQLISTEQWATLSGKQISSGMGNLASQMGRPELAGWVADLPPREETTELFHRGVEPFIQQDREASWEWINGLEDGVWRDRAFAEYSQQMLNQFNDPDASRNALNQIQDPEFKATATSWRENWERKKQK